MGGGGSHGKEGALETFWLGTVSSADAEILSNVSIPTAHHNRPQIPEQARAKKLDVICKMNSEGRRARERAAEGKNEDIRLK